MTQHIPFSESTALKRFAWHGQNRAGQLMSGALYGRDKDVVREQLAARGIIALQIRLTREPLFQRVSPAETTRFLQDLATLYDSGVPLLRILDVQLSSQTKPYFRSVIQTVRNDVERGENLHTALRHHPRIFDELTCNLIASGEESGQLSEVLNSIVTTQEQRQKIRSQIKTAMWYPMFVLLVAVLVWLAILIFVVPVFENIYRANGKPLPQLTQWFINGSHTLRQFWYVWLTLAVLGYAFIAQLVRSDGSPTRLQERMDSMRMRIPLIGKLLRTAWHAQFARTLGLLYQAGVPLTDALDTASLTVSSIKMRQAIRAVNQDVVNGQGLATAMARYPAFEPSLVQRVQIGEESGTLGKMLTQHAVHNEFLVEQGIKRFSTLIEPLMIVFIGGIVALVVVALYLPILNIGSAL